MMEKLTLLNGRSFDCKSEDCPFRKECANHTTAGDFRSEDGISPKIEKQGDDYFCLTRDAEVDMEHSYGVFPLGDYDSGAVYVAKDGRLVSYGGPYEEME